MNVPDDSQTEAFVCSMRWRPMSEEVHAASLAAALAVCKPPLPKPSLSRRVIAWVPRPVRWTLAACWTLSLGLRLATPAPSNAPAPILILAANDNLPSDRPLPLFASLEQTNLAIHELQLDLQSPLAR